MKKEPLITAGSITAAVTALLALLVAFGVELTQGQSTAILGVAGVVAPLIMAWAARAKVSPAGKLRDPLPPAE